MLSLRTWTAPTPGRSTLSAAPLARDAEALSRKFLSFRRPKRSHLSRRAVPIVSSIGISFAKIGLHDILFGSDHPVFRGYSDNEAGPPLRSSMPAHIGSRPEIESFENQTNLPCRINAKGRLICKFTRRGTGLFTCLRQPATSGSQRLKRDFANNFKNLHQCSCICEFEIG